MCQLRPGHCATVTLDGEIQVETYYDFAKIMGSSIYEKIDDKCEGYRQEIISVVSDILKYEREHRLQGTNIQQKINEQIIHDLQSLLRNTQFKTILNKTYKI